MTTIGALISAHTPRFRNGQLKRCLESVMNQDRLPDGIAVAADHEGRGAAWCKNQALRMLEPYDLIALVDSDDYWYSNHLYLAEKAFELTECDVSYSNWSGVWPFPEEWKKMPWDPSAPRHTSATIVVRRDLVVKAGGYRAAPTGQYEEDDWNLMLDLLDLGAKVHHIMEETWNYSGHSGNTSGRSWR